MVQATRTRKRPCPRGKRCVGLRLTLQAFNAQAILWPIAIDHRSPQSQLGATSLRGWYKQPVVIARLHHRRNLALIKSAPQASNISTFTTCDAQVLVQSVFHCNLSGFMDRRGKRKAGFCGPYVPADAARHGFVCSKMEHTDACIGIAYPSIEHDRRSCWPQREPC